MLFKKYSKDLNGCITKEINVNNKHIKTCKCSVIISKIQTKAICELQFQVQKKKYVLNIDKNASVVKNLKLLCTVSGIVNF
jgi:hypothetical protein